MHHGGKIVWNNCKGKEIKCKWFNGLRGSTTTILLDGHSINCFLKTYCCTLQTNASLNPHLLAVDALTQRCTTGQGVENKRVEMLGPKWDIFITPPFPKAQGSLWKKGQKDSMEDQEPVFSEHRGSVLTAQDLWKFKSDRNPAWRGKVGTMLHPY